VTPGPGAGEGAETPPSAPAPSVAALAALPADAAAWLLPHVRAALHALEAEAVTPVVRRLRAAPTGRLAGGRVRRELDLLLAAGGPAWRALVTRVREADDVPPAVLRLLDPGAAVDEPTAVPPPAPVVPTGPTPGELRTRERLRELREERDELRRQLAGATARASAAEDERDDAVAAVSRARERIAELERRAAVAADERGRAVDRERRRRDAEVARLERTVAELRRTEQERRQENRRREEQARAAEREAARQVAEHRRTRGGRDAGRLVPGRPSSLPADVHPGTTEAARLLLHAGRLVLVDGYNVTKQHVPQLDLEAQRAWLVRTLGTLAARRRVRPTVVFDGQGAAASRPAGGSREVRVTFTPAGVTADDELVLAVEGTDEPVVVVTDDRELVERVRASGADVLGTTAFLNAAR
jgi:predicted RNA-binding protein with PIN domain